MIEGKRFGWPPGWLTHPTPFSLRERDMKITRLSERRSFPSMTVLRPERYWKKSEPCHWRSFEGDGRKTPFRRGERHLPGGFYGFEDSGPGRTFHRTEG